MKKSCVWYFSLRYKQFHFADRGQPSNWYFSSDNLAVVRLHHERLFREENEGKKQIHVPRMGMQLCKNSTTELLDVAVHVMNVAPYQALMETIYDIPTKIGFCTLSEWAPMRGLCMGKTKRTPKSCTRAK